MSRPERLWTAIGCQKHHPPTNSLTTASVAALTGFLKSTRRNLNNIQYNASDVTVEKDYSMFQPAVPYPLFQGDSRTSNPLILSMVDPSVFFDFTSRERVKVGIVQGCRRHGVRWCLSEAPQCLNGLSSGSRRNLSEETDDHYTHSYFGHLGSRGR